MVDLKTGKRFVCIFISGFLCLVYGTVCLAGDAIINVNTNEEGVGAHIVIDGKKVTGLDENYRVQRRIPSTKGLLVSIEPDTWHEIYLLKKMPDGTFVESERKNLLGKENEAHAFHLSINPKIKDYYVFVTCSFPATLMLDGAEKALVNKNEKFKLTFKNLNSHVITAVDRSSGKQQKFEVSALHHGQTIPFKTDPPPPSLPPYILILAVAITGIFLMLAALLVLVVRKSRHPVAAPVQNPTGNSRNAGKPGVQTIAGWPDYLQSNYSHLEPVQFLKAGGIGSTWVVKNPKHKESLVKILHENFSMSENTDAQRFMEEALILYKLKETKVVPQVYSRGVDTPAPGVQLWFEMEYLKDWIDLRSIVGGSRQKCLALPEALNIHNGIVAAVKTIHKNRVLHRDLSPENIMIHGKSGRYDIKLIDFGIAKDMDKNDALCDTEFTTKKDLWARPNYAAEEQWNEGLAACTEKTDFYAVGIILWEMITGHRPYPDRNFSADVVTPLLEKGVSQKAAENIAGFIARHAENRVAAHELEPL